MFTLLIFSLLCFQSRFSPFAITRGQKDNKEKPAFSELNNRSRDSSKSQKLKKWLSMVTLTRKRVLLPVEKLRASLLANSKLHRTLYGFVVFEVEWNAVRGINYVNELQVFLVLALHEYIFYLVFKTSFFCKLSIFSVRCVKR